MKKIFTLISVAIMAISANAQVQEVTISENAYKAFNDTELKAEFNNAAEPVDGKLIVKVTAPAIVMEGVAGSSVANNEETTECGGDQCIDAEGNIWAWTAPSWAPKNQGDINYYYVQGSGVPYVSIKPVEVNAEDYPGLYKCEYEQYNPEVGTLPLTGLYYKFTPSQDGVLKVAVWANKGDQELFFVRESDKQPLKYNAEGYINGQKNEEGQKRWLTAAEVLAIHDAAKIKFNAETGEYYDENPWVVGAGNQPFWGNVFTNIKAGETYWVFQARTNMGFNGFEFLPGESVTIETSGISSITANAATSNAIYNLAGQKVGADYKGIAIKNGKKVVLK